MENHSYSEIIGNTSAPYINSLAQQNGLATNYFAVDHPSLPNYIALTAGDTFGTTFTPDCDPVPGCTTSAPSIVDEVEASGRTWKGYMESMGSACGTSNSGSYAVRHDPFVYFDQIRNNSARCAKVVDYSQLPTDLATAATTPNYVWITPNVCNDMHDCSVATGDTWLSTNLPPILASPAFTQQKSLLVLVFDEDDGTEGNRVVAILAGSGVKVGFQSNVSYTHYSLLRTIEWAWGLNPLTSNDTAASPLSDFFIPINLNLVAALPAMANGAYGGYTTSTTVQNLGALAATVDIQYFDQNGLPVGTGDTNSLLPPNASWTVRQDNGKGLAPSTAGSALVLSDQPVAAFVNEFAPGNSDATSYTGIHLPSGAGSSLYVPTIANSAYGGYTTGIGLVNAGTVATSLTINYRDGTGSVVKTQTLNGVAVGAYQALYSGDAGLGLPAGFAGTATITSSAGAVAAIVNETGPGGQFSSYDAVPAGSTTLYAPVALNNAFGGYNTGMGIQNTTATAGTVTINYYNGTGTATTKSFPISGNGYLGVYQGTDIPVAGAYTAKLTSTVGIAAIVNEVAPSATAAKQSTAYNTFAAGSSSLHLPLVESAGPDGWSTVSYTHLTLPTICSV